MGSQRPPDVWKTSAVELTTPLATAVVNSFAERKTASSPFASLIRYMRLPFSRE
jgi:hypothetical protein